MSSRPISGAPLSVVDGYLMGADGCPIMLPDGTLKRAEIVQAQTHPPVGATVRLHSLVGRADLNGTQGIVVSAFDPSKGRCGVKVDAEASALALKPTNLEGPAPAPPADVSDAAPADVGSTPPASAEDALIEAVQRVWLSEPSLSAKAVHAMMLAEGASVTLSDVKKAASKAAKRGGGSREGGGGAVTTLQPADPLNDLAAKRLGKLGGMDVCSEYAGALWTKLSGDKTHVKKDGNLTGGTSIPASGLFEALLAKRPAVGKRAVCYVSLAQVQHSLLLELAVDGVSSELRARPFSSWVYAAGGDELNEGTKALSRDTRRIQRKPGARGYRAEEWAADASRCRWLSEAELLAWCGKLAELRTRVEALVSSDLEECAPPGLDANGRRMWAKQINDRCEVDGLMMQPANMLDNEMVRAYLKMLRRAGVTKESAVVHRIIGNQMANAEQLLDFPLAAGAKIADLICELFGEHPSAATYTRMLEFAHLAEGWEFAVAEAKGVPGM